MFKDGRVRHFQCAGKLGGGVGAAFSFFQELLAGSGHSFQAAGVECETVFSSLAFDLVDEVFAFTQGDALAVLLAAAVRITDYEFLGWVGEQGKTEEGGGRGGDEIIGFVHTPVAMQLACLVWWRV